MGKMCFNPHPPLLAGETFGRVLLNGGRQVSIHTRHYWRVKPRGFQPRFARWGVSIHTRHYWRVKQPLGSAKRRATFVSIHTRHYWRVKPAVIRLTLIPGWFQSTPAITGG